MKYYEDIITGENGETKCKLCKISVDDSDVDEHISDIEHANLYMQRVMVQNSIIMEDLRLTCCMCEERVTINNIFDHIEASRHQNKMKIIKQTVLKDGGFLILPETISELESSINCLVCNRLEEFNLEAIDCHIASDRHKRARSIAVQPLNGIFSVENSREDLWCKICQIYFQNYVEIILEHVDKDLKHVTEINKIFLLIKDQNITIEKFLHDPKEDKAYCNKCKTEVSCTLVNLEAHIRGKKHNSP